MKLWMSFAVWSCVVTKHGRCIASGNHFTEVAGTSKCDVFLQSHVLEENFYAEACSDVHVLVSETCSHVHEMLAETCSDVHVKVSEACSHVHETQTETGTQTAVKPQKTTFLKQSNRFSFSMAVDDFLSGLKSDWKHLERDASGDGARTSTEPVGVPLRDQLLEEFPGLRCQEASGETGIFQVQPTHEWMSFAAFVTTCFSVRFVRSFMVFFVMMLFFVNFRTIFGVQSVANMSSSKGAQPLLCQMQRSDHRFWLLIAAQPLLWCQRKPTRGSTI